MTRRTVICGRNLYYRILAGLGNPPSLHDLSAIVWGGVVARDKGAIVPVVREVLGEFWKANAEAMAGLPLES
jgi:hypothetical protein